MILAAGGVLCRGSTEIMVVHRKRHADWSLPKGKLEPGESFEQAALREVREETGCTAKLDQWAGCVAYQHKGRPKVVLFWRMSVVEQHAPEHSEEVAEAVWLQPQEALRRLTYEGERELIARLFVRELPATSGQN
ncbi:MAG TPA: NUDIX domain-containing protein [Bryobacteraceae bacterium]|nr:NUDIX domain-containing protein [Bryobacteraceae bacterium]